MSWVRRGDTSGTHPALLAVREHPDWDDRLLNEVRGFVQGCAEAAAAHDQDYVVTRGTALEIGGPSRAEPLIRICLWAELFTETVDLGRGRVGYVLIQDPTFLNIRTKAEKAWEAQRKADSSNEALTVPVRLRDGDACRYCGSVVMWGDTRSARGGSYDHRDPGERGTVDTVVVACRGCNAGRRDDPAADHRYPLRPPPLDPYYHPKTVQWLTDKGHPPRPTTQADPARTTPRPGTQPDTAAPTPRPTTQVDTAKQRPGRQSDTAPRPASADTAPRTTARPAPAGRAPRPHDRSLPVIPPERLGRPTAGAGSAGSGRDGSGAAPPHGGGRARSRDQRPTTQVDTAPARPGTTPDPAHRTTTRPTTQVDPAPAPGQDPPRRSHRGRRGRRGAPDPRNPGG